MLNAKMARIRPLEDGSKRDFGAMQRVAADALRLATEVSLRCERFDGLMLSLER